MPPTATPLLLLGAVALFEPVNGYQIRRELLSWQVDRWANVQPGSIYHALGKLADSGDLTRHDLPDGTRTVAVYEITDSGRERLRELLAAAVVDVDVFDRRAFQAAFGLLSLVGDATAANLLDRRLAALIIEAQRYAAEVAPPGSPYAPPHTRRGLELWVRLAHAEIDWLTEVIAEVRMGHLSFSDQDNWAPPADDPGHQMAADRQRYRDLVDSARGTATASATSDAIDTVTSK